MIDRVEEALNPSRSREVERLLQELQAYSVTSAEKSPSFPEEDLAETDGGAEGAGTVWETTEGEADGLTQTAEDPVQGVVGAELLRRLEREVQAKNLPEAPVPVGKPEESWLLREKRTVLSPVPGTGREPTEALRVVEQLYRRTTEEVRRGMGGGLVPASVVVREEHTVSTGLTARELDRTVRRDSRRYDGAMHIY